MAERYGFLDDEMRNTVSWGLRGIADEIQKPVLDKAMDKFMAEYTPTRLERKGWHRLRAKLSLVSRRGEQSSQTP